MSAKTAARVTSHESKTLSISSMSQQPVGEDEPGNFNHLRERRSASERGLEQKNSFEEHKRENIVDSAVTRVCRLFAVFPRLKNTQEQSREEHSSSVYCNWMTCVQCLIMKYTCEKMSAFFTVFRFD